MATQLGAHSASLLGTHGATRRGGKAPAIIGGSSPLARAKASIFKASVVSTNRDVRIPGEGGGRGGQYR